MNNLPIYNTSSTANEAAKVAPASTGNKAADVNTTSAFSDILANFVSPPKSADKSHYGKRPAITDSSPSGQIPTGTDAYGTMLLQLPQEVRSTSSMPSLPQEPSTAAFATAAKRFHLHAPVSKPAAKDSLLPQTSSAEAQSQQAVEAPASTDSMHMRLLRSDVLAPPTDNVAVATGMRPKERAERSMASPSSSTAAPLVSADMSGTIQLITPPPENAPPSDGMPTPSLDKKVTSNESVNIAATLGSVDTPQQPSGLGSANLDAAATSPQLAGNPLAPNLSSTQDIGSNKAESALLPPGPPPSMSSIPLLQQPSALAPAVPVAMQNDVRATSTAQWVDDLAQKVNWVVSQKNQIAELHLNPPDLGPIDIVLKVSDNQATALFTSPHAAVREAVENALPKLHDLLAENGIMLSNATVSDHSPQDRGANGFFERENRKTTESNNPANHTENAISTNTNATTRTSNHNGIVDIFA